MNVTHARTVALVALVVLTAGCVASVLGSDDTSIQFQNATAEVGVTYHSDGSGGAGNGNDGVYVADVNRDGWQDFLAVGGERPVLFENTGGAFEGSDALPAIEGRIKGALFLDYDGDGWEDLLLLHPYDYPTLLHNDRGTLERSGVELGNLSYPVGATAADYDRDDDLDLFVYQTGNWNEEGPEGYMSLNPHVADDNGYPNVLYENTGDGFRRVEDAGIEDDRWTLAASFVDLNGDDYPDIHVANDFNNDSVYVNRGDGTFDHRFLSGATARNAMSSEIGDFNGDGHQDVYTTNIDLPVRQEMSRERLERMEFLLTYVLRSGRTQGNTLMINDGTGNLTDRASEYDVRVGGWGWAATHTDFDNDGDEDLMHATQRVVRLDPDDPHYTYPMLWERTGSNFTTLNASAHGLNETDGRGLATLDYDRDGDRDVIVASRGEPFHVYENVGETANSLSFRVVGENGTTAYGTTVTVEAGGDATTVQQTVRSDFLSQESRVDAVGLDDANRATVHVTWPDGTERTFEVDANRQVRISKEGIETVTTFED